VFRLQQVAYAAANDLVVIDEEDPQ